MNLSLLSEIESGFVAMAPAHLSLHGAHVHPLLEERTYSLYELRGVLVAQATPNQLRDAVWRHTIRRARLSQDWMVGALGLAMPMLRSAVRQASRGLDKDSAESLEAEVVTAAIRQIRVVTVEHSGLGYFLLCRVRRAAMGERKRAVATVARQVWGRAQEVDFEAVPDAARSCESVLEAAVRAGTLSAGEAELIARTRLEGVSLVALSTETGAAYKTLAKRRQRAEARLATALRSVRTHALGGGQGGATSPVSPTPVCPSGRLFRREASNSGWPLAS
ncbi:sigma-70 family RNA polymerase sigma factor [Nocardiopsis sp. N85]|uniref:sigma-70 family RNA polymerase sigma factor n=1 Tax=Nocardiopsis sp. N85 TaxID=3029400 RepID=UPI00237EF98E|nr:sigma-70 family RNA polymerase sigma factor [Nocardiopsis sp. N85]MDE3721432.1 sigma-70 family RNA polymerase sigma factor [Nocardiopsis sp. N85]